MIYYSWYVGVAKLGNKGRLLVLGHHLLQLIQVFRNTNGEGTRIGIKCSFCQSYNAKTLRAIKARPYAEPCHFNGTKSRIAYSKTSFDQSPTLNPRIQKIHLWSPGWKRCIVIWGNKCSLWWHFSAVLLHKKLRNSPTSVLYSNVDHIFVRYKNL